MSVMGRSRPLGKADLFEAVCLGLRGRVSEETDVALVEGEDLEEFESALEEPFVDDA